MTMTTQRRLGILVAAVALLASTGSNALAKRHKPKAHQQQSQNNDESKVLDEPATEEAPAAVPVAAATTTTTTTTTTATADSEDAKAEDAKTEVAPKKSVTRHEEEEPAVGAPEAKTKLEVVPTAEAPVGASETKGPAKSNGNADSPAGVTWKASGWDVTMYGYAALNVMQDSTQSFGTALGNTIIQRRGTIRGNSLQAQATARDSRLGMRFGAPAYGSVHASVNLEADFNAPPPVEYTESNAVTNAGFRMRHYYMKVETPVIDILAGQYHDLFGWGGKGFYPSTLAFLGITGEVYHRQPQIRLSKILGGDAVEFEIAGAALRPVQKAGGYPDVEAGLRLAFNRWTGARQQAYGQPGIGAMAIGVSAIGRHFEVAQFLETPGGTVGANGWGIAANAFLPVIPASNAKKRGNSLSLTGEYSRGTGIADMYSDLTGGLLFPQLPNSQDREDPTNPPPVYTPNIDPGIVTFDGDNRLRTCDWEGFVAGLQYYLPILDGRVWVSATHSQLRSDNIVEITPAAGRGGIYDHAWYYDGSLFVAITDAIQMGVALQRIDQRLGDGVKTQNYRTEFGMHMFF
jgi:hypothetical protein